MNIQVTLLFVVATINSLLSLLVLLGKRDKTNIVYSLFVVFASFWAIGLAFFILEIDLVRSLYIANFYYVAALGIPIFFYYFSLIFLNTNDRKNLKRGVMFIPLAAVIVMFLVDKNFLIKEIFMQSWGKDVVINSLNYLVYGAFFVFFVALSYINLFKIYFSRKEVQEKNQVKFVLWGTSIGFLFGMIFDLVLPFLGDYKHIYIGPIFSLFMVGSIAYAITKYRMFDMKVVVTETFVLVLWLVILVRTVIATTIQEQITNGILLISTIVVGIFIIKSVKREVEQKEKIEKLAQDLKKTNDSLEKANDRLKSLDQLKSEFLSLATHQIRGPLTAIKGYASLILDGDYGKITEKTKGAVQVIFNSTQNLVVIVNEFLDISRIEQGRMKYDLTTFDVQQLLTDIITELKPNIDKAGLSVNFDIEKDEKYTVNADMGKLKQVIGNLIDNSIKYTPHGGIIVGLRCDGGKMRIIIKDTGIGIASDDIPKLFGKFSRAKDAFRTNVIGTGLGLYVAKQMIEAQGGRVWVESAGVGKGSTFFIELPENK